MDISRRWINSLGLAICCTLAIATLALKIIDLRPASNYVDAMALGQYDKARDFLVPEVELGNPDAETALGNLHYLGLGGSIDHKQAASLYHSAASKGHGAAQLNLAHLYKQGFGVNKSAERAFGWYVQANIANNPWAEYYMRQMSTELTLSPLQMNVIKTRWEKLAVIAKEPL